MQKRRFVVFQIRQFDGSFRFVLAKNEDEAKRSLRTDERIMGYEYLEQVFGGDVEIVDSLK